jgi:hypothetical protein
MLSIDDQRSSPTQLPCSLHSNIVPISLQDVKTSIATLTKNSEESKKVLLEHQQKTASKLAAYQEKLKTMRRDMGQEFEKTESVLKELRNAINESLAGLDNN